MLNEYYKGGVEVNIGNASIYKCVFIRLKRHHHRCQCQERLTRYFFKPVEFGRISLYVSHCVSTAAAAATCL